MIKESIESELKKKTVPLECQKTRRNSNHDDDDDDDDDDHDDGDDDNSYQTSS